MIEKNMVHSGIAYIKERVPDERYRVYMVKCLVIIVYYVYSKEVVLLLFVLVSPKHTW